MVRLTSQRDPDEKLVGKAGGQLLDEAQKLPGSRGAIARVLQSVAVGIFIGISTLYVLFIDDILTLAGSTQAQQGWSIAPLARALLILKVVIFFLFLVEFILTIYVLRKATLNFFCLLDFITLLSFIPDLALLFSRVDIETRLGLAVITRVGRAARMCARAPILLRVVKFVKIALARKDHKKIAAAGKEPDNSRSGAEIVEGTTVKMTVIVLLLFLAAVLLQTDPDWQNHAMSGLTCLEAAWSNASDRASVLESYKSVYGATLVWLDVADTYILGDTNSIARTRENFLTQITTASGHSHAKFDISHYRRVSAAFEMGLIVCVLLALSLGNFIICHDATKLVGVSRRLSTIMAMLTQHFKRTLQSTLDTAASLDPAYPSLPTARHVAPTVVPARIQDAPSTSISGMLSFIEDEYKSQLDYTRRMEERLQQLVVDLKHCQMELRKWRRQGGQDPDASDIAMASRNSSRRNSIALAVHSLSAAAKSEELTAVGEGALVFAKEEDEDIVVSGTLQSIVQHLTSISHHADTSFVAAFLYSYRRFMTPTELLEDLIARYCLRPPASGPALPGVPPADVDTARWQRDVQLPVRNRVVTVLYRWVTSCFGDFRNNVGARNLLDQLLTDLLPATEGDGDDTVAAHLRGIVNNMTHGRRPIDELGHRRQPPPPIITPGRFSLHTVSTLELARQMTLVDAELYRLIEPLDLVDQAWLKPERAVRAANLVAFRRHCDTRSLWFSAEIVATKNLDDRVALVGRLIDVAGELQNLGNWSGTLQIMTALASPAVARLSKTWEKVMATHGQAYAQLKERVDPKDNYVVLSDLTIQRLREPFVPFLDVYMNDLVDLDRQQSDRLANGDVNFRKCYLIADSITAALHWQPYPYSLTAVPDIAVPCRNPFPHGKTPPSKEELLEQSEAREPPGPAPIAPIAGPPRLGSRRTRSGRAVDPTKPGAEPAKPGVDGTKPASDAKPSELKPPETIDGRTADAKPGDARPVEANGKLADPKPPNG